MAQKSYMPGFVIANRKKKKKRRRRSDSNQKLKVGETVQDDGVGRP